MVMLMMMSLIKETHIPDSLKKVSDQALLLEIQLESPFNLSLITFE